MPQGVVAVLAGAVTVFFALTGAEITTIAAAESAEPARAAARMSTSVDRAHPDFLRVVDPADRLRGAVETVKVGESPFTLALTTMGFGWASTAMCVIILTAVLSCLNSAFYVCSRVLFMLAEHGDAPQWLVKLNARQVPARSVWIELAGRRVGRARGYAISRHGVCLPGERFGRAHGVCLHDDAFAQIRLRRERERAGAPAPQCRCGCFPGRAMRLLAA